MADGSWIRNIFIHNIGPQNGKQFTGTNQFLQMTSDAVFYAGPIILAKPVPFKGLKILLASVDTLNCRLLSPMSGLLNFGFLGADSTSSRERDTTQ